MEYNTDIADEFVHLARLALTGRPQDVQLHIRRVAKRCKDSQPDVAAKLLELLRESPTRASPLRRANAAPVPIDLDSRLQLVRTEFVKDLDVEPIYESSINEALHQLVQERKKKEKLVEAGLVPSSSGLFTGPPGVGKSLAARWLARELNLPLLVLDLSAVMSSFLGRTGNNVRYVLDYAKSADCILLLDELDAIAKRRDDATEVGELKRLVTVLLQEIDDWPADGLLLAATNHSNLLDPAIWRRFDLVVEFPMPGAAAVKQAVERFLGSDTKTQQKWKPLLSIVFKNASFSDIERTLMRARRAATIGVNGSRHPFEDVIRSHLASLSHADRKKLAANLVNANVTSQRRANEITGISRDTIRKAVREREASTG